MMLVQKRNNDWWLVRKNDSSGTEGFVPANYVKDHEPKVVKKVVRKKVTIPETVMVKKTVMKKEVVKAKRPSNLRRAPSSMYNIHFNVYLLSKQVLISLQTSYSHINRSLMLRLTRLNDVCYLDYGAKGLD